MELSGVRGSSCQNVLYKQLWGSCTCKFHVLLHINLIQYPLVFQCNCCNTACAKQRLTFTDVWSQSLRLSRLKDKLYMLLMPHHPESVGRCHFVPEEWFASIGLFHPEHGTQSSGTENDPSCSCSNTSLPTATSWIAITQSSHFISTPPKQDKHHRTCQIERNICLSLEASLTICFIG